VTTRRAIAVLVVALVLVAAACGSGGGDGSPVAPGPTATSAPTGTRARGVTTRVVTYDDASRTVPEGPGGPAESSRRIEVWLTLPEDDGPAPLIVFSHGMAGHPRKFEHLARVWAEAGYAVAAPAFPRSNADVPAAFTNLYDVPDQPGDVSFVVDRLLAASADPSSDLAGRFDPDRLGAAGHSAGGWTTYRVAVDPTSRDPRFAAAAVMSAPSPLDDASAARSDVPVLVIHGDRDPLIGPAGVVASYLALGAPKHLVTLLGAGHAGAFEDPEDALEPKVPGQDEVIAATTVAFWDRYLLGDPEAGARLAAAGAQPDLASYQEALR
jgi:dienelactone hydrolase